MNRINVKSRLIRFYSNPMVGFLGSTASILALIAFFYMLVWGGAKKELTYYCDPVKSAIVRAGHASALEIIWNNEKLNSDVTASSVAIWNRGKRPIEGSDILEEVTVYTQPKMPILEAQVRKVSRDVTKFAIDKGHMREGYISVSWKILEQNDGGVIQLIYEGNEEVKILAHAIIKEQRSIKQIEYTGRVKTPSEQIKEEATTRKILALLVLFTIMLSAALYVFQTRRAYKRQNKLIEKIKVLEKDEKYKERVSIAKEILRLEGRLNLMIPRFIVFISIISLAMFIILMFISRTVWPPFGF
jgi:hypothetical protein